MKSFIVICVCLLSLAIAEKVRFDNYKVYSAHIQNDQQMKIIQQLENSNFDGFSLWNTPHFGKDVDIMVAPHRLADFDELLKTLNFNATLKIANVQKYIYHIL